MILKKSTILFVIVFVGIVSVGSLMIVKSRDFANKQEATENLSITEGKQPISTPNSFPSVAQNTQEIAPTLILTPVQAFFRIDSVTPADPGPEQMMFIKGAGFGQNFNSIIFYLEDGKTINTGPYNWIDKEIQLFLPKELPQGQSVQVAVKRTDNKESNRVSFKINSALNPNYTCDAPANLQASDVKSDQIKLIWSGVSNIKEYGISMSDYYQNQWSGFYGVSGAYFGENLRDITFTLINLKPNTYFSFVVRAKCTNEVVSKFSNQITVKTAN